MKIHAYGLEKDDQTVLFEMNEAYFRFEHNLWSRFDDQGENNEERLTEEQQELLGRLVTLHLNEKPVFRKVLFYKNEIRVTLTGTNLWSEQLQLKVIGMIKLSWPIFFKNTG